MDKHLHTATKTARQRPVKLDHHDSVRSHVREQVSSEVARLERRIETLRLTRGPHAEIMISAYQRMLDRKKGFLLNWDLRDGGY
ncbi:hypothetical protein DYI22_06145 [Marinobacter lipolyticus]|uniref:hypothetical protein n=1 Tax=Marinobacter lipolyticus TaxID=209639 RepID=UPI001BD08944|nr:hypothetical protein [Marinobacter lipolyticus]MBS8240082.1 hypothetical protein [Marinobacter lipolyticus]